MWAGRLATPGLRDVALRRYLSVSSQSENEPQRSGSAHFSSFLQSLGLDGRLLLAVVSDYCGPVAAADLTNHLWLVFKDTPLSGPTPSASIGPASAFHTTKLQPSTAGAFESSEDPGSISILKIGD